ncbi:MAG: hypothetical protein ACJ8NS_13410 [Chthoniobacterales bacterium]
MIGVIFLLGAGLFGMGLVRRVFAPSLNQAEQALWGLVIGWSVAAAIGYGFARLSGGLNLQAIVSALLLVWSGAIVSWLPVIKQAIRDKGGSAPVIWEKRYTPLASLLCIFAPIFLYLFNTHMLQVGPDGAIHSGGESSYYDMAFHAAITTSFVHGANFPPVYTPMAPAPLLYPFFPDFLTALLVAMGMNLHSALVCTAVPLTLALTGIFYFLALRLVTLVSDLGETRAAPAAAIATLLFLLNGGVGFLYFFQDWWASGNSLWRFLSGLETNYSHLPPKALVWPNIVTDMLLPQRTSIFGLSLGFIILACFAMAWDKGGSAEPTRKWIGWRILLVAGFLAGALPLFHVHSYIAVGLVSGILFLLRPRRVWLAFWLPAIALAAPRFLDFSGHLATIGFVRFRPGWRGQDDASWIAFWFRNVGLPGLLVIPAWLSSSRSLRLFYLPFLVLLALTLLVVFSPNDYDNLKLMTYWQGITAIVVAAWLSRIALRPIGWVCSIAMIALSVFSGALAILAESHSSKVMFGPDEVAAADFVKANTTPHSLFLTAPSLHQPVLSLAGRAVVRGPTAWLWSHGYPFAEREADVRGIYAGRDDALDLLRYYRVDYVYLGPRESEELTVNRRFFDDALPSVYRTDRIAIYDARKLRTNDARMSSIYPPREYASRVDRDPAEVLNEFSAVAYELYRLYEVAYGKTPLYQQFMSDLRRLGRDLYPGNAGWFERLSVNKQALCDEWTQRPDFRQRHDNSSPAEYVNRLFANAGLPPGRDASDLAAAVTQGRETRATVLRRLSADRRLFSREYNAAYVLCHYFGYLKRNPDETPDRDLTGYKFWRRQLDRTHDYRGITRAFLESDEYKRQTP